LIRQGKLDVAAAVLHDNDEGHQRELGRMHLAPTSAIDLALAFSLLGRVDDATQWCERAERRADTGTLFGFPGMRIYVRAVIACRRQEAREAAKLLDEQWADCETLKGNELRPLRVLRAFAHATADIRNVGIAESLLVDAKPRFKGEYDFLGVAWAEMQQFLVTHKLVSASAPAGANPAATA
jgi:hypothetical protein